MGNYSKTIELLTSYFVKKDLFFDVYKSTEIICYELLFDSYYNIGQKNKIEELCNVILETAKFKKTCTHLEMWAYKKLKKVNVNFNNEDYLKSKKQYTILYKNILSFDKHKL